MERRNFFKKIAGVIAGIVVAPFVIEAAKNEQSGFYTVSGAVDRHDFFHNGEFVVPRDGINCQNKRIEIHKLIIKDPNILNGLPESKERHEQRKAIYRSITQL